MGRAYDMYTQAVSAVRPFLVFHVFFFALALVTRCGRRQEYQALLQGGIQQGIHILWGYSRVYSGGTRVYSVGTRVYTL